ncbi:MAG: Wzz/FepE/Etk N-terminal domain-containing protein [Ignavibacteria bacterium]|nr:Wzz/FepE/Etk N-terminal domain-containing protein [Ignavibacteria bacterium]
MDEKETQRIEFNFTRILKVAIKHYKFILLFTILTSILVVGISYLLPHKYESKSTLLPPEEIIGGSLTEFLRAFSNLPTFGSGRATKIQLYYEMLKSKELAKFIAQKDEIKKLKIFKDLDSIDLQRTIYQILNVDLKQSGLFIITAKVPTGFFPNKEEKNLAAKASALVVKFALEGLDTLVHTRISTRSKRKRVLIENLLAEKKFQLDSIEKEIEDFQRKNKIIGLDEQSKAILSSTINIGSELAKAEIELSLFQTEYEQNSPYIKALRDKIQKLREQYSRVQTGGLTGTEAYSIPLEQIPSLYRQYMNLLREQKILEQVTIFLETQKYTETIQESTEIPGVDVLDTPTIPISHSSPNRKILLLFSLIISFIVSVAIVTIKSYKKGEIK